MLTFKLLEWSDEARVGLEGTYNGCEEEFKAGVESGRMRLWRVGGHSYAITQADGDALLVWAYQGQDVLQFALAMCQAAQQAGFDRVRFGTKRRGLAHMLRALKPVKDGPESYTVFLQKVEH